MNTYLWTLTEALLLHCYLHTDLVHSKTSLTHLPYGKHTHNFLTSVSLHGVCRVAMLWLLWPLVTCDSVELFKSGQQASYLHTHTCTHTQKQVAAGVVLNDRVFFLSVFQSMFTVCACVSQDRLNL